MPEESNNNRVAVVSDIHGNASAFKAVLEDVSSKGIRRVFNLGDIVGYCGQTVEAVDLVKQHAVHSCAGNHDDGLKIALAGANEGGLAALLKMNLSAAKSVVIASSQLKEAKPDPETKPVFENPQERIKFLTELPDEIRISYNAKGMHSTKDEREHPRYIVTQPFKEKLGIKDSSICQDPGEIVFNTKIFPIDVRYVFVGHTHVPCFYLIDKSGDIQSYFPKRTSIDNDITGEFTLKPRERAIVVVGSVGVARDLETEIFTDKKTNITFLPAAYTIFDPEKNLVQFVEIKYDASKVIELTRASGMPDIFSAIEDAI